MFSATSTPIRNSPKAEHNGNGSNTSDNNSSGFTSTTEYCTNFPYPACWQDEQRMHALLSSFRNRDVNPESYDSKLKFWSDIITKYCEHKGSSCFCKRELQDVFSYGKKIPYGLETVFQEMLRTKQIRKRKEYESDPLSTWASWAMNSFVKKPFTWGLEKLKSTVGWQTQDQLGTEEYVHLTVINKFCKELEATVLLVQQGKLLHYEAFKTLVDATMTLKEDCLRLCLHTLYCQRKIGLDFKLVGKEQRLHLIKIPYNTDANIAITESDHAMHNLRMTQEGLLKQLKQLEQDIKENDGQARKCIMENKRKIAKTYLRKKHLLEQNYEKRSAALHNVEKLLLSIEEAQSNGEILDAYKFGSKALQKALDDSGLKYDNVEEVIADMHDTMDAHREVLDAMNNINVAGDTTMENENDDLERELQEILGETNKTPIKSDKTDENNETNSNNNVTKAKISDAELLAMLEGLKVDASPVKNEKCIKQQLSE